MENTVPTIRICATYDVHFGMSVSFWYMYIKQFTATKEQSLSVVV